MRGERAVVAAGSRFVPSVSLPHMLLTASTALPASRAMLAAASGLAPLAFEAVKWGKRAYTGYKALKAVADKAQTFRRAPAIISETCALCAALLEPMAVAEALATRHVRQLVALPPHAFAQLIDCMQSGLAWPTADVSTQASSVIDSLVSLRFESNDSKDEVVTHAFDGILPLRLVRLFRVESPCPRVIPHIFRNASCTAGCLIGGLLPRTRGCRSILPIHLITSCR